MYESKTPIKLAVFLQVSGYKWDQMAGFKYYATKNNLGPMSIPEWKREHQKYLEKPTG